MIKPGKHLNLNICVVFEQDHHIVHMDLIIHRV